MIAHLFKLVWNRRRMNALILLELFLCFLVLAGVLTYAAYNLSCWRRPLGFSYDGVWRLDLSLPTEGAPGDGHGAEQWNTFDGVRALLGNMEEIEAATPLDVNVPFGRSMMGYRNHVNGVFEFIYSNSVVPEAMEVMRLELIRGRWLEPGDEALSYRPVVITKSYARALFGDAEAVGQPLPIRDESGAPKERPEGGKEPRVVGVLTDYRPRGELHPSAFAHFGPFERREGRRVPQNMLLRLRSGVPAAFEEELVRAIQALAPGWTVTVASLAVERDAILKESALQILTSAIVAGFLTVMVGLGLVGVLWQGVSRRTEEWGLRRALGATTGEVRWQVLGALLALTTIAAAAGTVIFLQVPLLGLFPGVGLHVYAAGLVAGLMVIYAGVAVCGAYPSWLATRVHPAEALQHE